MPLWLQALLIGTGICIVLALLQGAASAILFPKAAAESEAKSPKLTRLGIFIYIVLPWMIVPFIYTAWVLAFIMPKPDPNDPFAVFRNGPNIDLQVGIAFLLSSTLMLGLVVAIDWLNFGRRWLYTRDELRKPMHKWRSLAISLVLLAVAIILVIREL
jgi:hypothetical protein